jgi:hypothetical protein
MILPSIYYKAEYQFDDDNAANPAITPADTEIGSEELLIVFGGLG